MGREGEDRYRVWCGEEEERKREGGKRQGRRRRMKEREVGGEGEKIGEGKSERRREENWV